ncbi:MAG: hypothetical protein U0636_04970 [Phycisphaerales bacterium]
MTTFLEFTHTEWTEAPRLRHQVARLLVDHGHTVYFFERSTPWRHGKELQTRHEGRGPTLVQTRRLLHHQLRVAPPLHWANARVLSGQIRRFVHNHGIGADAVILNFNYDFYFLRRLFPRNRILTIINDDFEAMCRLPYRGHVTWALKRTCQMSDEVLTVSTPLQERLSLWCKPKLFLPWSVAPYQAPVGPVEKRTRLLFWGFVDKRLDLDLLDRLAETLAARHPSFKIMLVGPTQGDSRPMVEARMARHANVEIRGRTDLDDLPRDELLAALIPYKRDRTNDAILQTNKTMQLLAKGLPLVISGMPAFMRKPYILRLDEGDDMAAVMEKVVHGFAAWQPEIKAFVEENSPESRLPLLGV